MLDQLWQDVKFGLRTLAGNPGVTVVAVISLALATGATAAIFSIVNSVLLRPLPFFEPHRIVRITETAIQRDDLDALRRQSVTLAALAEYYPATLHLRTPATVERVAAVVVDRYLFDLLGAQPISGRTIHPDDGQFVAVISERLWRSRFGADSAVAGTSVTLDDHAFTIVGVMPERFQFPHGETSVLRGAMTEFRADVWIGEYRPLRSRVSRLVARLKPGATPDAAAAELTAIEQRRASLGGPRTVERLRVMAYSDAVLAPTRRSLSLLFAAVTLVLLAACANVANLLLALTSGRARELATRVALGASRARLARQLLVESLLLAAAGGVAAVFVGRWTRTMLVAFGAQRIPRVHEVAFDWPVFAFLLLACGSAALLFGIAPALAAGRVDAGVMTRESGRATTGRVAGRIRNVLVASEVALAVVLATCAGVVMVEMARLRGSDNGMVTTNVVTVHLGQPLAPGIESQYAEIAERVERLSDVDAAGFTQVLPLQNWGWRSMSTDFFEKGGPPRAGAPFLIELRYITPGYFRALGIPVRRGRGIVATDARNAPSVIVINETLARLYFGTEDPVGREMNRGRIVGVIGDVRQVQLDQPSVPEIYFPMVQNWSQVADLGMTLVVRTAADPEAMVAAVRAQVAAVNPRIAIFDAKTMDQVISDSLWSLNLYRWLIGWFAVLTLVLSAVGLSGVIAYSVAARRREWALRLALGSTPRAIAQIVLRQGLALGSAGIVFGGILSLVALLGVAWLPVTGGALVRVFAAVALVVMSLALAAAGLPALRVGRIEPAAALRHE
jgi:predicted permease